MFDIVKTYGAKFAKCECVIGMPQAQQSGGNFAIAKWRSGFDLKHVDAVARKIPLSRGPLIDYYSQGNSNTGTMVSSFVRENGPVTHPANYGVGIKSCADARQATHGLSTLLRFDVIHERTAGSVVRSAHFAKHLRPGGFGIVEGHRTCGACAAAHEFEMARLAGHNMDEVPPGILKILMSMPEHVRRIHDPAIRDPENAIAQAFVARRILALNGHAHPIYPAFFDWGNPQTPYRWLGEHDHDIPVEEIRDEFAAPAVRMLNYAFAEGRDLDTQYATMVVMYDPYRLGRINEPHAIMSALGNELFCVTFNFDPFDPVLLYAPDLGRRSSKSMVDGVVVPRLAAAGMGSVLYAAFDKTSNGYGHVRGVGGPDGTHIVGILDTSMEVLLGVKDHLLGTYVHINELTNHGATIVLMHYDRDTAKVTFVE